MTSIALGTNVIEFSAPFDEYRKLRLSYHHLASKTTENFLTRYEAIFRKKQLIQIALNSIAQEYLQYITEIATRNLVDYQIIDIDDVELFEEYTKTHLTWNQDVEEICDKYLAILLDGDSYNNYLAQKNAASRSPFIGGGFGLEGAVGGMLLAGAANTLINGVNQTISAANEKLKALASDIQINQLMDSKEARNKLSEAVYRLIFRIHFTIVDIVNRTKNSTVFESVTVEDVRRSDAIARNISRGRIIGDLLPKAIITGITLNPFNKQLYELWHRDVEPLNNEFTKLESLFGFEFSETISEKPQNISQPNTTAVNALAEGAINIISGFQSKDLFIHENIPERKRNNSKKNYFCTEGDTLLALIDTTLFGSADTGLAFGLDGIYGKHLNEDRFFVSWDSLGTGNTQVETTLMGVKIGGNFIQTSDMSKATLVALISNLSGYFQHRGRH